MIFTKEKINKGFFVGVILLTVVLLFTIIDREIHGLESVWGVPDYYFKDKIPAAFFWGAVGLFFAGKFKIQNIWLRSLFVSGVIAVALQVRYFIEGYDLNFVLLFLIIHFAILLLLLAATIWLAGKYNWLQGGQTSMKKIIIVIIIVAVLGLATYYFVFKPKPGQLPPVAGNSVSIKDFSFNPPRLLIKTGQKVTWTNNDTAIHTVTSDSGNLLASPNLAPGGKFEFTFASPGSTTYHCELHPTMAGEIIVEN